MGFFLILGGLLTHSFLAVLVGMIGARRNIGFGWAFLLSVLFSPLVGLIVCLLSDPREDDSENLGCLGTIMSGIGILGLLLIVLMAFLFTL